MTRFFDALGRFSVRFRYPIVLVWLAGAVAAAQLLPTLASAVDNDNTAFLPSDSPSVRETGVSPDGRAAQVQVLANVSGFGSDTIPLVEHLRGAIGQANPPPGLHTAGQVATAVDNNARSGETGNRTQQLSVLFVLVLLLVVFRSLLAPVLTLLPLEPEAERAATPS